MIGAAVKGALLRPALRVALDGGVDHETIHGRQDKPAAVELKKSTCCTSFVKPPMAADSPPGMSLMAGFRSRGPLARQT
jgi:hypothetical protein